MRLVTFRTVEGGEAVGALLGEQQVLDLTRASGGAAEFRSMIDLIAAGDKALDAARRLVHARLAPAILDLATVRLLAPIPRPPRMRAFSLDPRHLAQAKVGFQKLLAPEGSYLQAGRDYPLPAAEPGYFATPVYWFMDHYCVSGPDDHVKWPAYSDWVDYELEIAAVIGNHGRDIGKAAAGNYIFGYTILNDLSARDAQLTATATGLSITAKGKDFAGSYALGPCIVTKDEVKHGDMHAILRVNGEEWARGTPAGRHWTFEDGIAYASQAAELVPGEIFSSATVANCCGLEVARKGMRGDCVELEVEEIGVLRTWID